MSAPVICCFVPRKSRTGSRISRTTFRCGCCSTDRKSSAVINDGQHRHLTGADPSRPSDREGVQLAIARGSAGSSASISYLVYLALDAMPSVSPEPFEPPTGSLLTFRPSDGSIGIAATPCWPKRQDSTLSTKCAFGKEWPASGRSQDVQVQPLLHIEVEGAPGADVAPGCDSSA